MEFPGLGDNCSQPSCKRLDFLPMKCDACSQIFCKEHIIYTEHSCPESYKKDNQVPVCPLCNAPVPVKKGDSPDVVVGRHIDNDCQSDPAKKRRKVYSNRCSKKGCKVKELIPFKCEACHLNYCLKHRHETDHGCTGFQNSGRSVSNAGAAAIFRNQASGSKPAPKAVNQARPQQTPLSSIGQDLDRQRRERAQAQSRPQGNSAGAFQAGMTEDEALAVALAASMADSQPKPPAPNRTNSQQEQEAEDAAFARALAESEREARRPRNTSQQEKEKSCILC